MMGAARLSADGLEARACEARDLLRACRLCANRCGIDRIAGARGTCGAGVDIVIASVVRHFGEEPPLVGRGGSGAVFFCRCTLACLFCQNHQASQGGAGRPWDPDELAGAMLRLEREGAVNINLVTPTQYIPQIID
ncbi:MAG: radical SAM protein, partial [Planctomycetes bacterium]|nr:radical SAM protein [Planctomycetota bacterium]